ncbi:MAG: RdgB/HAM1 family non-canonical purine NTP pyrophosphatase [Chloroflexi bacterium]|nr:RdgB/HAM1 family non-canonical purine NTP pyrophosphatase [Chloroflexota bacterium]
MARQASLQTAPRLLIATNNKGKLREYQYLLRGLPCEFVSLAEAKVSEVVCEEGQTFGENAALKARGYRRLSGLATLADDSGLEVDALGGRPGIHSARYGGRTSDEDRISLLLEELAGVPWEQRTARFACVIGIDFGAPEVALCYGYCSGIICYEPRGAGGFGYDPVFYLPELGKTMAELSFEEKNSISHRAAAAKQARAVLVKAFESVSA